MREHEVPTHVQAEDRVLLWFTFPQIVALTAVCALSYGVYRYAPLGPAEARIALAVVQGLAGVAMIVGKIGGRRLPLVAADLLRFWLGTRRYAGPPADLVRSEPPAPVQPAKTGPGPLGLMARRALGRNTGENRKRRKEDERGNKRRPFRPHGWFGKRRRRGAEETEARRNKRKKSPKTWQAVVAAFALAAATLGLPQPATADEHGEGPGPPQDRWRDEIEFEVPEPVPGRRIYIEGLQVSGERAEVTLRAATDLYLRVRAYGGDDGREQRYWRSSRLAQGEEATYSLPLHGPTPSLTFSWVDGLAQAGAYTLEDAQLPHPLPSVEGELCRLRVVSLAWAPGTVNGTIRSDCVPVVEEAVDLLTVAGYQSVMETALMDAQVTAISGSVSVAAGGSQASVPFVAGGDTTFRVDLAVGAAVHVVNIEADLEASLSIARPPLVRLTRIPGWTERRTETVVLLRPGVSRTVSETVTVDHPGGTTTEHVITAHLSVPSEMVDRQVTFTILHPERIEAEVVERWPTARTRHESLEMGSSIGSDKPFERLVLPDAEPEPLPAEQAPLTGEELNEVLETLEGRRPR